LTLERRENSIIAVVIAINTVLHADARCCTLSQILGVVPCHFEFRQFWYI
jgi:hypothetical protein